MCRIVGSSGISKLFSARRVAWSSTHLSMEVLLGPLAGLLDGFLDCPRSSSSVPPLSACISSSSSPLVALTFSPLGRRAMFDQRLAWSSSMLGEDPSPPPQRSPSRSSPPKSCAPVTSWSFSSCYSISTSFSSSSPSNPSELPLPTQGYCSRTPAVEPASSLDGPSSD